jgi:hypothetical protein
MNKLFGILSLVVILFTSGCYWNYGIGSSEVGIQLDDGISVSSVVQPGRYTNGGFYAEMRTVDLTIKTVIWNDPSLVTSDKQPIGLTLGLSYRRMGDTDSVKTMYNSYRNELFDDNALQTLVFSRVPDVAKGAANRYSIDQLIGRVGVDQLIMDELKVELEKVNVSLVSVQIQDVAVDPGYLEKLSEKAQVILQREMAIEQVQTAEQNLLKEQAQTEIDLEIARRQNLINQELAKTYELNDRYFQLKRLELLQNVFGVNDKIVFVPEGSDLSVILNDSEENVVPVTVTEPTE